LTPDNLFKTVVNFVASAPVLAKAILRPRTSPALREKVVLGVTSVNDCRYCKWGHTSIFFEGAVAAAALPIFIVVTIVAKLDRKVGMDEMQLP